MLLSVLYASGARAQELCDLRIRDVRFEKGKAHLHLNGQTDRRKEGRSYFSYRNGTLFHSPVLFDFLGDCRWSLFQDRSDVLKGTMVSIVFDRNTVYNRRRRYKSYETNRAFRQSFIGRKRIVIMYCCLDRSCRIRSCAKNYCRGFLRN